MSLGARKANILKKGSFTLLCLFPHSPTCFGKLQVEIPVLDSEI